MIDKSRTIQLLNDASRIIAVGYLGLVVIGFMGMKHGWTMHPISSGHTAKIFSAVADPAIFLLTWPVMAFLLSSRLWLWSMGIGVLFMSAWTLFPTPGFTPMLIDALAGAAIFLAIGSILCGIGLSGTWLAKRLHVDQKMDRYRYWWIAAIPCILLLAYANTAGQKTAFRTISKQAHPHDSLSTSATFPNITFPMVLKRSKYGPTLIYTLDPTGRIIIMTGEYFD